MAVLLKQRTGPADDDKKAQFKEEVTNIRWEWKEPWCKWGDFKKLYFWGKEARWKHQVA